MWQQEESRQVVHEVIWGPRDFVVGMALLAGSEHLNARKCLNVGNTAEMVMQCVKRNYQKCSVQELVLRFFKPS